jgi:hypothetical protein
LQASPANINQYHSVSYHIIRYHLISSVSYSVSYRSCTGVAHLHQHRNQGAADEAASGF